MDFGSLFSLFMGCLAKFVWKYQHLSGRNGPAGGLVGVRIRCAAVPDCDEFGLLDNASVISNGSVRPSCCCPGFRVLPWSYLQAAILGSRSAGEKAGRPTDTLEWADTARASLLSSEAAVCRNWRRPTGQRSKSTSKNNEHIELNPMCGVFEVRDWRASPSTKSVRWVGAPWVGSQRNGTGRSDNRRWSQPRRASFI